MAPKIKISNLNEIRISTGFLRTLLYSNVLSIAMVNPSVCHIREPCKNSNSYRRPLPLISKRVVHLGNFFLIDCGVWYRVKLIAIGLSLLWRYEKEIMYGLFDFICFFFSFFSFIYFQMLFVLIAWLVVWRMRRSKVSSVSGYVRHEIAMVVDVSVRLQRDNSCLLQWLPKHGGLLWAALHLVPMKTFQLKATWMTTLDLCAVFICRDLTLSKTGRLCKRNTFLKLQ